MGKSNTFDFSNKKNTGVGLGQFIRQKLAKELDKAQKLAARAVNHSWSNGTGGSAESKELCRHVINLQVPSKDLRDEGLYILADGLEFALKAESGPSLLALECINISGNGLTASALARLASVIKITGNDLKTLNLTNNAIKTETDQEAAEWQTFLCALHGCVKLCHLDLSGNPLGARAMEIFARTYISEDPVSPFMLCKDASMLSMVSEKSADSGTFPAMDGTSEDDLCVPLSMPLADAGLVQRRCGLQSIPFISLRAIGLTGAGALWLSYVIERHQYPSQLMDAMNAPPSVSSVKTDQQCSSAAGIDWMLNDHFLGKEGMMLLQKTESVRCRSISDNRSILSDSMMMGQSISSLAEGPGTTAHELTAASVADSASKKQSTHPIDDDKHGASELESARKRMQRHIIEQASASSVELWHAALKAVNMSRMILLISPTSQAYMMNNAVLPRSSTALSTSRALATIDIRANGYGNEESCGARIVAANSKDEPTEAVTNATNSQIKPGLPIESCDEYALSEGHDIPAVTKKLSRLVVCDGLDGYTKYQQERIRSGSYWDIAVSSRLPYPLIERIVGYTMRESEFSVLSEQQKRAAFSWGQDKVALRMAGEWRKKDEASQVWMLLDNIKCLAYGQ